jgi:hypothetical protein
MTSKRGERGHVDNVDMSTSLVHVSNPQLLLESKAALKISLPRNLAKLTNIWYHVRGNGIGGRRRCVHVVHVRRGNGKQVQPPNGLPNVSNSPHQRRDRLKGTHDETMQHGLAR